MCTNASALLWVFWWAKLGKSWYRFGPANKGLSETEAHRGLLLT